MGSWSGSENRKKTREARSVPVTSYSSASQCCAKANLLVSTNALDVSVRGGLGRGMQGRNGTEKTFVV